MRSLDDARRRGREARAAVDTRPDPTLVGRLLAHVESAHGFYPEAVHPDELDGCHARLEQPYLYYDERLEQTPDDLLLQLAHELGHLEQHPRVKAEPHRSYAVNPLASAPYVERHDVAAVARYSQRSLEEAEATAFAVDFLCPTDGLFAAWRAEPESALAALAARFSVPADVARAQLVAAVFEAATVAGGTAPDEPGVLGENRAQDRAVVWPEMEEDKTRRPLLVDAGPGTGKTETLVRRVAHLVGTGQVEPEGVLVLTFSNEAAAELKDRLRRRLAPDVAQRVMTATFHGFGRHLLHYLGGRFEVDLPGRVPVLDEAGQEELVLDVLGRADAAERFGPVLTLRDLGSTAADAVRHINHLKQRLWDLPRLRDALRTGDVPGAGVPVVEALVALYGDYEAEKEARGYVDFADLILLPLRLLTDPAHAEAADVVRRTYPHVLVDEFQDVSEAVGQLLQALCTAENPPWVVGDARQAIYRFMGAHPDNVRGFLETFVGAERIELDQNYRSCGAVVGVNNELAVAMGHGPSVGPAHDRWRTASDAEPFGEPVVGVASAASDAAERAGVADHVAGWVQSGVRPEHIAVLARRNVDVREIALALGARGIAVATSGLVTSEGPAGDLAAVAAVLDTPDGALVRVAAALARGRFSRSVTNAAIRALRAEQTAGEASPPGGDVQTLTEEVRTAVEAVRSARGTPDAFGLMTTFLFEASLYLRRILEAPAGAARTMQLAEVATALSEAALYRFTHGHLAAPAARRSFVAYFGRRLTDTAPGRIAPRRVSGAVQVMTVHAAKGLQFPFVVVAGQTIPPARYRSPRRYPWLPEPLRPTAQEDSDQADATLFVGVSRARRSLVVSYAETASGREGSDERDRPLLLDSWVATCAPATWRWPDVDPDEEVARTERVWGGAPAARLSARAFEAKSCPIRVYVGDELGLRLPEADRPLYPVFFARVRAVLGALVETAHDGGRALSAPDVERAVGEHWPPQAFLDHRHLPLYTHLVRQAAAGFAARYVALATEHRPLDLGAVEASLGEPAPKLSFASAFLDDVGRPVAVLFRPGSLAGGVSKKQGGLNWSASGLDDEQVMVAVLQQRYPGVTAYVYSAADAELYPWNAPAPPRKGALPAAERLAVQAEARRVMLAVGPLEYTVSDFECDRCRSRLFCPYWNALAEP